MKINETEKPMTASTASRPGIQSKEERAALHEAQVRLLYANLPTSIIVNMLLALLLAGIQRPAIATGTLIGWLAVLGVVQLARAVQLVAWKRRAPDARDASHWLLHFRASAIATGVTWGTGAILLSPPDDMSRQVYVAFVLAGLTGGAITSLAIDRISTFGFVLPALLPYVAFFATENSEVGLGMSGMVALFLFFIAGSAIRSRRNLTENVLLRIKAVEDEEELRHSAERLNQAQRIAHIGNWELDLVRNELYWSDEIYRIFEIEPDKFTASYEAFLNAVHPDDRDMVNKAYTDSLVSRKPYDIDHRLLLADGRVKYVHEHGETDIDEDGKAIRSRGTVQDITERKMMEEQVQFLADHDPLTRLPNRNLFADRLLYVLAIADRDNTSLALMFIDLDDFKPVNDEYGHDIGDHMLQEVAQRIHGCLRKSDTVARIGGDEFIVLLPKISEEQDALAVAEKIHSAIKAPFELAGHSLVISSCIGIAIYPEHAREQLQLMKYADTAMYHAKAEGRNSIRIYQPGMRGAGARLSIISPGTAAGKQQ
ncbi:MAG TPA: sensor domain-containing diguanylate cyclase [Mariprofundaceae bacterium]|nr:sensor domain-containing diguanylate cyclase [Mariprofundaceae bacterium]